MFISTRLLFFLFMTLIFHTTVATGQFNNKNKEKNTTDTIGGLNDTLYLYIENQFNGKLSKKLLEAKLKQVHDSLILTGLIFNRLKADSIAIKKDSVKIYYGIKFNVKKRIDSIVVINLKKFPVNISKKVNNKFKGKDLSTNNISKTRDFIKNNTPFSIKDNYQINFSKAKNIVVFSANKQNNNTLEGFLGFNYDNEIKKLKLEGAVKTQVYNLFNINESFLIDWKKRNDRQQLNFDINLPYLLATDFSVRNYFLSSRKDSSELHVLNKTILSYNIHKHKIGVSYTGNLFTKGQQRYNNKFAGINYKVIFASKSNNKPGYFNSEIYFNLTDFQKRIIYLDIRNSFKVFNNFYINPQGQVYLNQDTNTYGETINTSKLFRKNLVVNSNYNKIISLKNTFGYSNNKTFLYLISDYIHLENRTSTAFSYLNTGAGIEILNKNQILTFEVIKPLYFSYLSNYQGVYINVKQTISF